MTDELRKAICDYFDPGEFAELVGVKVEDLIDAFPEEVEECLDELLEIMEWKDDDGEE